MGLNIVKRLNKRGRVILTIILPLLLFCSGALGAEVKVVSTHLSNWAGRERIVIDLKGLDSSPIQEAINGGIPYTVEYQVRIMRERSLWDKTIWEGIYTRTLRLNIITKEYRIEDPTAYPQRFTEKMAFMKAASHAAFPLPKGIMEKSKGNTYIEVRVYRNSIHLFFPFSLLAPLIRPDSDFDTGWIRVTR